MAAPLDFRTFIYDAATDRIEPVDTYALPDGHLHVFLTIGAAALKQATYSGPARPVSVRVPGYVVAAVDTFAQQAVTQGGTSYTAAAQALREHVAANPRLKGMLIVASSEVAA